MPVPTASGVSVISIGMLKPRRDQVVAWRGPMLDRALVQMLSDVYWGDLDVLLLDLPPGTGDVAISLGQHLPGAEVVVVTTPQEAAAEVAERAGTMASMMHQRVVGVVENMSYLACPHCGPEHQLEVFGSGGGDRVAATLSERFGYDVPVLGRIPLGPRAARGRRRRQADRRRRPDRPGGRRAASASPSGSPAAAAASPACSSASLPAAGSSAHVRGRPAGDGADRAGRGDRVRPRQAARARPPGRRDAAQGPPVRQLRPRRAAQRAGPRYADLELRDLDPRTIVRRHIVEAMEEPEVDAKPKRRGLRPLGAGEVRRTTPRRLARSASGTAPPRAPRRGRAAAWRRCRPPRRSPRRPG